MQKNSNKLEQWRDTKKIMKTKDKTTTAVERFFQELFFYRGKWEFGKSPCETFILLEILIFRERNGSRLNAVFTNDPVNALKLWVFRFRFVHCTSMGWSFICISKLFDWKLYENNVCFVQIIILSYAYTHGQEFMFKIDSFYCIDSFPMYTWAETKFSFYFFFISDIKLQFFVEWSETYNQNSVLLLFAIWYSLFIVGTRPKALDTGSDEYTRIRRDANTKRCRKMKAKNTKTIIHVKYSRSERNNQWIQNIKQKL